MSTTIQTAIVRSLAAAAVILGVELMKPAAAEAQARGTMQVYAQVVDTRASTSALETARSAIRGCLTTGVGCSQGTVSTVASVSVARPADEAVMVVTIDYSKD